MSASKERLAATIAGERVDRPPVSLWRHNFLREWSAADLADETLTLYDRFDWDLIKLNCRWSYLPEAWGNLYQPPTEQRFQRVLHAVVQEATDLDKVEPADAQHPSLLEQLEAIETVTRAVGDEVDLIHTVFSPLAVGGLLTGGQQQPLLSWAEENPEGLDRALIAIRETVLAHSLDALERGASGIFFAPLPWTSLDLCSAEAYARFGRPHDLWVLERLKAAKADSICALHVCGNNIGADRFDDYPVDILSWDDRGPGNPTMAEYARASGKCVMGGVPHRRIHKIGVAEMEREMRSAVEDLQAGYVFAGGCATGAVVADDRMRAPRDIVERWS